MRKRLGLLAVAALAALAFLAPRALADGASVTVVLTGVSGGTQGGVYTSPYFGSVGGVTGTTIVCDDFNHEVFMGESWTAFEYNFSDLSGARFQGADPAATLQMYDEAAYLITQLAQNPSDSGDISFAIWAIFSPNVLTTSGYLQGNAAWWLNQAENQNYYPGEYSNFLVLTPEDTGSGSPQEYLVMTPEPATLLLLSAGILGLGFWTRRTRFTSQLCS
jgi:PEP-CTERM motif